MPQFRVNFSRCHYLLSLLVLFAVSISFCLSRVGAAEPAGRSLLKSTRVSIEKAEEMAMAKFPEGSVEEIELDRDDSPLVWKIDLKILPRTRAEVEIDANSGEILKARSRKW